LVLYVAVSVATPRTSDAVLTTWTRRLNGSAAAEPESLPVQEGVAQ
jgi:SSS family solute:Na+ symporter